jgi:biopolymer transport protein ExbD
MARIKRHHAAEVEESHGIDLAPMLDFVLNLLIFFIIIAVFVKESGMLVNRPTPGEPPKDAPQSITVQILENGEVWVDGRVVDPRAVSANIERLHAEDSKRGVMVMAHPKAHSGLLVTVVDEIHLGGVWNITFATGG